jgi:hypothetical protein
VSRLAPSEVALVLGKRGSGKSHAAKLLLAAELDGGARVVAFDPHDEYSQKGRKTAEVNLGPLEHRVTVAELEQRPEILDARKLSLAVVPTSRRGPELAEEFEVVSGMVTATGRLTFCADEIGEYSAHATEEIVSLATQSRHYSIPLVLVAQRATQVPKTARSQASRILCGRQDEPDDLAALEKRTRLSDPNFAAKVSRLPRRQLLEWRDTN